MQPMASYPYSQTMPMSSMMIGTASGSQMAQYGGMLFVNPYQAVTPVGLPPDLHLPSYTSVQPNYQEKRETPFYCPPGSWSSMKREGLSGSRSWYEDNQSYNRAIYSSEANKAGHDAGRLQSLAYNSYDEVRSDRFRTSRSNSRGEGEGLETQSSASAGSEVETNGSDDDVHVNGHGNENGNTTTETDGGRSSADSNTSSLRSSSSSRGGGRDHKMQLAHHQSAQANAESFEDRYYSTESLMAERAVPVSTGVGAETYQYVGSTYPSSQRVEHSNPSDTSPITHTPVPVHRRGNNFLCLPFTTPYPPMAPRQCIVSPCVRNRGCFSL